MEINAEISKVFGTEMAKLFASSIDEKELNSVAKRAYDKLIENPTNSWGSVTGDPELVNLIKSQLLQKVTDRIKQELETSESEEVINERAKRIIDNAKKLAEEELTLRIAGTFVNKTIIQDFSSYQLNDTLASIQNRLKDIEERRPIY